MGPFVTEYFHLTPAQTGFMISAPILAGALMRFPLGILSQYIGRKNAAIVEMSSILVATLYGYFFVTTYNNVLAMGVLLGIAGASFGVALSLGARWFPKEYKDMAMGIAGAGNSGTVLAALLAPPLATAYGWRSVYGFAALMMLLPLIVMIVFAKEPPDHEKQTLKEHLQPLLQKDRWTFNAIYVITFGGFIEHSAIVGPYHGPVHVLLCCSWSGKWSSFSTRAAALAAGHGGGGQHDRRSGRARWFHYSQCHGVVAGITGSFASGFIVFAVLAAAVLGMLLYAQRSWTKTWVGKGGKALLAPVLADETDAAVQETAIAN
jgi:nitrate/nitrite transporter NarK